jgi:CPA1 family monovalent cation:H+ antiporter
VQVFEYVFVLLVAVLLSNVINRFVPVISVPIIQMVLGGTVAFIPFGFEFQFDPDLFFVLFIAPLVYYTSMTLDKSTMWKMKGPIIGSAVALVFITVCVVGLITHLVVSAISFAAACVLIGALGPTDDVAVDSVRRRVAVPPKIMGILSGESIINDASGIVAFQFALAAITTGSFSIGDAAVRFLLLGFGGAFVGLVLIWLKLFCVRLFRSLGMENAALHILLDILTPFVIYMAAEALEVSGILAIFTAGIVHSFLHEKYNPETVKLHIAQENVWATLAFTLNGIVFVMLGTQLPAIFQMADGGFESTSGLEILGIVFLIMGSFILSRFLWWMFTVRPKSYHDPENPIGRFRAGVVFGLAGARGAVTLASVMSIPILLSNGSAFPDRDLIIVLASGVIVVSLLITNFILPLFTEEAVEKLGVSKAEEEAYAEIIQTIISRLLSEATEENRAATLAVVGNYYKRDGAPHVVNRQEVAVEKELLIDMFCWERENTLAMLEKGLVDENTARHFIGIMDVRLEMFREKWKLRKVLRLLGRMHHGKRHAQKTVKDENMNIIRASNMLYVQDKLRAMKTEENADLVEKLKTWYELSFSIRHTERPHASVPSAANPSMVLGLALKGFQMERDLIQEMYEAGRLTWKTAREMRGNIATLEARLQDESV